MWQDMCRSLAADMQSPYLKSAFSFVSSDGNFQSVLEENGLPLRDRIGVALRFLPEEEVILFSRFDVHRSPPPVALRPTSL